MLTKWGVQFHRNRVFNLNGIFTYPGNIRFMVCIIESEQFLSFTCNSANFDYIWNDFKQKSPKLNVSG